MRFYISAIVVIVICLTNNKVEAGCDKDIDCKGERICENGSCIYPKEEREKIVDDNRSEQESSKNAPAIRNSEAKKEKEKQTAPSFYKVAGLIFKKEQIDHLYAMGVKLDEQDKETIKRLRTRGYNANDFVKGYDEYYELKRAYPEFSYYGRGALETVIVANGLQLGGYDMYWLIRYRHDNNTNITTAYNEQVLGGRSLRLAGIILSAAGVGAAILGGALYGIGVKETGEGTYDPATGITYPPETNKDLEISGIAFLGLAGALISAGIPCLIIGQHRMSNWLPEGRLDSNKIKNAKLRGNPGKNISINLNRSQKGLGITMSGIF